MGNEDIEEVYISLIHFPVKTLGPGTRIGIWFQGCKRKCANCISSHTWEIEKGERVLLSDLKSKIEVFKRMGKTEGITISGGEPFLQPYALKEILDFAKNIGIEDRLVYTGFEFEEIINEHSWIKSNISVLIDGKYIEGNNSAYIWKGSENQKLIIMSENPEIIEKYKNFENEKKDKKLQMIEKNGNVFIIGIPEQKDRDVLLNI